MSKQEVMLEPFGEFCDIISCFSVYNGAEEIKEKLTWNEIMALE